MNRDVTAERVLAQQLGKFRSESYQNLVARINKEPYTTEILEGETLYQFELLCVWDDRKGCNVRAMGMLDGGNISAWRPITDSFIKAPDGSFVDE